MTITKDHVFSCLGCSSLKGSFVRKETKQDEGGGQKWKTGLRKFLQIKKLFFPPDSDSDYWISGHWIQWSLTVLSASCWGQRRSWSPSWAAVSFPRPPWCDVAGKDAAPVGPHWGAQVKLYNLALHKSGSCHTIIINKLFMHVLSDMLKHWSPQPCST